MHAASPFIVSFYYYSHWPPNFSQYLDQLMDMHQFQSPVSLESNSLLPTAQIRSRPTLLPV